MAESKERSLDLLRLRGALEDRFLGALRMVASGGDDVTGELDALLVEPAEGRGVSHRLMHDGTWERMREYLAHRSLYQLKEAWPSSSTSSARATARTYTPRCSRS